MSLFPLFLLLFSLKWWDWMPWYSFLFWMLRFQQTFSLFSFTLIKRFNSSSLSTSRVVSSAYLRLFICLSAVSIPACDSSTPAFHMMYSVYKLNKQGDNTQPSHTPFPIWSQSVVPCPVLLLLDFACRFFRRQVRWSGTPISLRIFHSLLWSTQSKALVQSVKRKFFFFFFSWKSLAFSMIQQMLEH